MDTGNVFVVTREGILGGKEGVVLYTHSEGEQLCHIVSRALARKARWDDPSYLARIIFSQMVKGKEEDELGFGISTEVFDTKRPIILIDAEKQELSFCYPNTFDECLVEESIFAKWTFEKYINLSEAEIQNKWTRI